MSWGDEHRGEPHTLVLEDVLDDGTIEYTVAHPATCEKEIHPVGEPDDLGFGYYETFNCGVEYMLNEVGISEVMADHLQRKPEVGEYRIVCVSTYDTYTHESDVWIEEAGDCVGGTQPADQHQQASTAPEEAA